MPTLRELSDEIGMPEREIRVWAARLALPLTGDDAGGATISAADGHLIAIVRRVLECPYATPALAIHVVEATRGEDYPDDLIPRDLARLHGDLLRLVDAARDAARRGDDPAAPPATGGWLAALRRLLSPPG